MRKADHSAVSRTRLWTLRITVAGAACAAASACGDAPMGPTASWVATETAAALRMAGEPPTLGRIVASMDAGAKSARSAAESSGSANVAGGPRALNEALGLWREASRSDDPVRARALREEAYRIAAPRLARSMGAPRLEAMRTRMAEWIDAAERLPVASELGVTPVLEEARGWLKRSREAEREGDQEAAIIGILRAADLLETLTPHAVADRLIESAQAARTAYPDPPESGKRESAVIRRAERLLQGARAARARGEPVRAIQRAYYALRLLESS